MVKRYFVALTCAALPMSVQAADFQSTAPFAYMVDMSTGAVLYAKNADRRLPPASMTKMMTSHVVFDMIREGKIRLDSTVNFSRKAWDKWHGAGSTMFLRAGEKVSVENLLKGVIALSGNDACIALAEGLAGSEQQFVALMNEKARKLGMRNTHFGTSTGWPDGGVTYSTAYDLALLGKSTIEHYPDFYRKYYGLREFQWGQRTNGKTVDPQANRNPILGKIAGADGIKTGHTEEAGFGFAGSAAQNGRRIVMVVAGLPTFAARITESVSFMDWGFKSWVQKPVLKAGQFVEQADVQLGDSSRVGLVAATELAALFPVGQMQSINGYAVSYDGPIRAPIKKGQHIADLVVKTQNGEQRLPLVAQDEIAEAGFFRRAWLGLLSIFGL